MANAKTADNREKTALAVDDNGVIKPLLVDPTTGRLLINITVVTDTTPVLRDITKPDENHHRASMAYDGTDERPLLIDNRNGLLFCDCLCE